MKKCFFLVVCLVLVISVSLAETVSVDTAIKAIESVLYAEGFDYYFVSFNEDMNTMNVHVAIDGIASTLIGLKHSAFGFGANLPSWIQIKANLITLVEDMTDYLESIGFTDVNVVLTLENDDLHIRGEDVKVANLFTVSTLSLEMYSIIFDYME